MTTARDLITLALQDAGITGQGLTPRATDINNAFIRLNDMMQQWEFSRWLVYHLIDTNLAMTGATSYTIGVGGNFSTPRPDRIEAARIIQINPPAPNDVGWPLQILQAREDYNSIRMQHLASFPRWVFYDAAYPLGIVYPWPLPSNQYTLRLTTKALLQTFANLSEDLNLPNVYKRAIRFNLQSELIMAYKLPEDPATEKKAMAALNLIKNSNFQMPVLQMPQDLVRPGVYNILSDNVQ